MRQGDVLTLADGTTAVISKTYAEQLDEPVIVYNFEVKDFHTYYVTDTGVLVHNANKKYVDNGNNNSGDFKTDPPSKKSLIKDKQLPTEGNIRYIPPENWNPANGLPTTKVGGQTGYIDRFGNIWVKGPSRIPGQEFEWDVQLSNQGKAQIGWATRDGSHANVTLDGRITHK